MNATELSARGKLESDPRERERAVHEIPREVYSLLRRLWSMASNAALRSRETMYVDET